MSDENQVVDHPRRRATDIEIRPEHEPAIRRLIREESLRDDFVQEIMERTMRHGLMRELLERTIGHQATPDRYAGRLDAIEAKIDRVLPLVESVRILEDWQVRHTAEYRADQKRLEKVEDASDRHERTIERVTAWIDASEKRNERLDVVIELLKDAKEVEKTTRLNWFGWRKG